MIAAEGQRASRISDHRLSRSIARLGKALEKELAELDRLIGEHMRGSTVWVEKEKLLASVPGNHRPNLDRRTPGTRFAQSSTDRRPRWPRTMDPPVRAMVLALIAVARKLITILNAILRDQRPWQPLPA
jgi:transposase